MRGLALAVLGAFCVAVSAATPTRGALAPELALESGAPLQAIVGWLKLHGQDGYVGADVADAIGIPRLEGEELLAARQRGFRSDDVLRIAQAFEGLVLFMVQQPDDQVYFYLSSPLGGLQKALLSIPSKNLVVPLGRAEAELRFRHEVQYWMERSSGN